MQLALFGSGPATPILTATAEDATSAFIDVAGCVTFGMQVTFTGAPSALIVTLYGSNDGVTIGMTPIATWDKSTPQVTGAFTIAAQNQTMTVCVQGCRSYSIQCVTTGSPSLVVKVYGSSDGTTIGTAELGKWDSGSQASGDIVAIVDCPVQFVILKATTYSGGTNPTANAFFAGV